MSDNLTACPVCKATWLGAEIPDGLMEHNPEYTREQAEEAAAHYGWTPDNGRTFSVNVVGVEYPWNHPQRYDGVSEWRCTECGARIGRWSGAVLEPEQVEARPGRLIPVYPSSDEEWYR